MLLIPIFKELWPFALLLTLLWLALPVLLVSVGKFRIALAVQAWWVIMFGVIAYLAFANSAEGYDSNRDAAIGSSFGFMTALICSLASLSSAGLILLFDRRVAQVTPLIDDTKETAE